MNPRLRTNWTEIFQDFRAMIDAIPAAHQSGHHCVCGDCGSRLFLVVGRHSGQYFYSHEGLAGCSETRAIFFPTREAAEQSETIFL